MIGIILLLILLTLLLGPSFVLSMLTWIFWAAVILTILGAIGLFVYYVCAITGNGFRALDNFLRKGEQKFETKSEYDVVVATGLCIFCVAILGYALFQYLSL